MKSLHNNRIGPKLHSIENQWEENSQIFFQTWTRWILDPERQIQPMLTAGLESCSGPHHLYATREGTIIRCGYTRPLAHGEPSGYGLGWVYPGLWSTPRLRLHACKLPKGKVSVNLIWRETYLHVNMEDLNDELFFGLISVIVTARLLNRPPQLSSAIQRFILRRQRRRRLQSRFLQSLQLSHLYFRRRLAAISEFYFYFPLFLFPIFWNA